MRFDVITIFPGMFDSFLTESILGRARERGLVDIRVHDLRAFCPDRHRVTDDYPFGGGAGMVMKPEPIFTAVEALKGEVPGAKVVLLTPQGGVFGQRMAKEMAGWESVILICGRYEGVDERVVEALVDREISIGDYVLNGGEVPAMVLMEAVTRLVPGVVGKEESTRHDSFQDGLLEYPHYTRPAEFRGLKVPEELLSGHHANIEQWRRRQAILRTARKRPDLLEHAALAGEDREALRVSGRPRLSLAIVHYPVRDREGRVTATAVTPMTVHDLARVARTYDMDGFYVITPLASQQALLRRITRHYTEGYGAGYNPSRKEALELLKVTGSLNEAIQDVAGRCGAPPKLVATGASGYHRSIDFAGLRGNIWRDESPYLLLFGTSWGLDREIMDECDHILEPIAGRGGYNHLPVREAAAIIIDRLLGPRGPRSTA